MATITEDYVSFEVAKLLKEKGFNEKCQKVYMHNGQLLWAQNFMEGESFLNNKCIKLVADYDDWITYTQGDYAYLCPTLQMAMKWFREDYNIIISITPQRDKYYFTPWQLWDSEWVHTKAILPLYDTYEQACEAAIKYCLKNLI